MRSLAAAFHRTCPHQSYSPNFIQGFKPAGPLHRRYNSNRLVCMPVNDVQGAKRHKSGITKAQSETAIDQGIPVPEILQSKGRNLKVNYIRRDDDYEVKHPIKCLWHAVLIGFISIAAWTDLLYSPTNSCPASRQTSESRMFSPGMGTTRLGRRQTRIRMEQAPAAARVCPIPA